MKVEKVRSHFTVTTDTGIEFRIKECKDGVHIVCVTGDITTRKTHGNAMDITSDESRKF